MKNKFNKNSFNSQKKSNLKLSNSNNKRGVGKFAVIVLSIFVLINLGFAGWWFYQENTFYTSPDFSTNDNQGNLKNNLEDDDSVVSKDNKSVSLNAQENCVISGKVILPSDIDQNANDLTISYGLFIDRQIKSDGSFCITDEDLQLNNDIRNKDTYIDVMVTKGDIISVYLRNTIGPNDDTIEISPLTTAISQLSSLYLTNDNKKNKEIRNIAGNLTEVKDLSNHIEKKLIENSLYLRGEFSDDDVYADLISKAMQALENKINKMQG